MTIDELLRTVILKLEQSKLSYALAGGLVASLYRVERRLTADIDILLAIAAQDASIAEKIIEECNLKPNIARRANLEGGPLWAIKKGNSEPMIVVGRDPKNKNTIGLDFLLTSLPWVSDAIKHAQNNLIDWGVGKIPTITVEDLLIAKAFAVTQRSDRFKDLDDIKSILEAKHDLNLAYLKNKAIELKIKEPKFLIFDLLRIKS